MLSAAIPILLAASLAAPIGARALSDAGFEYTVTGGTATVTGCTSTCPTNLVIPDTLGGYPVTTFSEFAFAFSNLTNVTIPSTVTSITRLAFYSNSIISVTIPNSVTSIGQGAFYQNNLTTALAASFSMENSINVNTFENGILVTQKEFMDFRNIRLFDLSGKEIMNRRLSSPIEKIGLSQLPRGIYLYEISLQGTICQSGKVFLN
jgi:hypothetical protein